MRVRAAAFASLIAALALPAAAAPERYTIDPDHTYPSLEVPHMGISVWRGKVRKTRGHVVLDREARTGEVDITVQADTIDFGHRVMNEAALGADWLHVEMHPTLRYVGPIRFEGDVPSAVEGELTLLGTTRPVRLKIESFRCSRHPLFRREVCGADASGRLDRAEFGMKQATSDGAGIVTLRIQVEAMRQ